MFGAAVGGIIGAMGASLVTPSTITNEALLRFDYLYGLQPLYRPYTDNSAKIRHEDMLRRIRNKDHNMSTRLKRRRVAIWNKWACRAAAAFAIAVALPLVWIVLAWLYGAAIRITAG